MEDIPQLLSGLQNLPGGLLGAALSMVGLPQGLGCSVGILSIRRVNIIRRRGDSSRLTSDAIPDFSSKILNSWETFRWPELASRNRSGGNKIFKLHNIILSEFPNLEWIL